MKNYTGIFVKIVLYDNDWKYRKIWKTFRMSHSLSSASLKPRLLYYLFFRCELACFDQVGRTGLKPNSDFRWLGKSEGCATANQSLLAWRWRCPTVPAPDFRWKNRLLQHNFTTKLDTDLLLNNFCKVTLFFHYFANSIFMLAFKHQSNFGCSLLTLHS